MAKRCGDAFAPVVAALIEKRFHEEPTRVTEHRDQQKDAHGNSGDLDPLLPKIDLELVARRGLHAHRRERRRPLRSPQIRDRALDRARRHDDATLGQEPLHDHRIAGGHAGIQLARRLPVGLRQLPRRRPDLDAGLHRLAPIAAHRVTRHAQLLCDGFAADASTRQIANRGHDVAVDHRYLRQRRYQNTRLKLHSTLLPRGSELVSRGGQYHCRSTPPLRSSAKDVRARTKPRAARLLYIGLSGFVPNSRSDKQRLVCLAEEFGWVSGTEFATGSSRPDDVHSAASR
jgi:hypothetical protein